MSIKSKLRQLEREGATPEGFAVREQRIDFVEARHRVLQLDAEQRAAVARPPTDLRDLCEALVKIRAHNARQLAANKKAQHLARRAARLKKRQDELKYWRSVADGRRLELEAA